MSIRLGDKDEVNIGYPNLDSDLVIKIEAS